MVLLLAERLELVERHHLNALPCIPERVEIRTLCLIGVIVYNDLDRGRVGDNSGQCAEEVAVGEDADNLGLVERVFELCKDLTFVSQGSPR